MDFVYDNVILNGSKTDLEPLPMGADPNQWLQAVASGDWNDTVLASYNLRGGFRSNKFLGVQRQAVAPPVPTGGALDYVWADNAGNLFWHKNGTGQQQLNADVAGTVAQLYAAGTSAVDQTALIQAAAGGAVVFKANAPGTGALLGAQNSAAVSVFGVADNTNAYLAGAAANTGSNKGVVLDTLIALTSGRHYLEVATGGVAQWAYYTKGTGERALEALAGTSARLYGNGELVLSDNSSEGSYLRLYSGSDNRLFAFYGNILSAGTTNTFVSRQGDGGGIIGLYVDTTTTWVDPTAQIQRWLTGGFQRLAVMALTGALRNPSTAILESSIADAGSNVGVRTDTINTLTNSRHYFEICTGGVPQWAFWNNNVGQRSLQALAGVEAQIFGNGLLTLLDSFPGNSALVLSASGAQFSGINASLLAGLGGAGTVSARNFGADSATATVFKLNTFSTWSDPGARLLWGLNNNTEVFSVMASGIPRWANSANVQTTVGAAGGASALPATPSKYLKVQDDAGTTYVVPCYLPS